jgi:hypothetical protein
MVNFSFDLILSVLIASLPLDLFTNFYFEFLDNQRIVSTAQFIVTLPDGILGLWRL